MGNEGGKGRRKTITGSNELTKRQVADHLKVSLRAVNRYIESGKLSVNYRQNPGGWREAIFDSTEVKALKEKLEAPLPVKNGPQERGLTLRDTGKGVMALLAHLAEGSEGSRPRPQSVPVEAQLGLTLDDAAQLLKVSRGYLLEAIKAGKLKAQIRGKAWNIKRSDLDDWYRLA